jgi:hypothetical protein
VIIGAVALAVVVVLAVLKGRQAVRHSAGHR